MRNGCFLGRVVHISDRNRINYSSVVSNLPDRVKLLQIKVFVVLYRSIVVLIVHGLILSLILIRMATLIEQTCCACKVILLYVSSRILSSQEGLFLLVIHNELSRRSLVCDSIQLCGLLLDRFNGRVSLHG